MLHSLSRADVSGLRSLLVFEYHFILGLFFTMSSFVPVFFILLLFLFSFGAQGAGRE